MIGLGSDKNAKILFWNSDALGWDGIGFTVGMVSPPLLKLENFETSTDHPISSIYSKYLDKAFRKLLTNGIN